MSDKAGNPYATEGQSYQTAVTLGGDLNAGGGAGGDLIKDTTTSGFSADVIQASRAQPVLVDFWAPWCGPCKQLTPVLERVVQAARGAVKLVKMNIDEHPSIAGQLGIQSIPAVIAFKNGQPVDGFMGAVPETQIKAFIDKLTADMAGGTADLLTQAEEAKTRGEAALAADLYAAVLDEDEANVDALAGLANLYFDVGQVDAARELLERVPQDKAGHVGVAALHAKFALADQIAELGDENELQRRLDSDPADHAARFDLALIANARGNRDEAADQLLAIMKADREWREDGARQQLLKFFEAWGMTDRATLSARRKLSGLLFR
ncbi:thioredoxin [Tianweitania sp. BSSL-BM11]|uniref:Thioredoxin n=1 Tax=Tianweitania aestuarii TaxID=2814886 RepID=A0ABS5RZ78_9HYPH|nr:thioredoxin [Tianweitania aestuarii]MBS9721621.1 thioredoxin [Tianweitania aestuarii]